MYSKKIVVLAIFFAVFAGAISLIAKDEIKTFVFKSSCIENGGKWASNGSYCISRHCAADGTCLPASNNNDVCARLALPIDQDELYFEIGMPERQTGSTYIFAGGAMGSPVTATIENSVVTKLNCAF